jgi:O-antigen chain-terminating methyltransferase
MSSSSPSFAEPSSTASEPLDVRLARLERERLAADRAYNDALTALDRAIGEYPDLPHPPPGHDAAALADLSHEAEILAGADPAIDRSIKGRLRGLVWRLVAPILDRQQRFNARVIDQLARSGAAHDAAQRAVETTIAALRGEVDRQRLLHSHLIQYLQTITLYVDTKDRMFGGQAEILNAGLGAVTGDFLKRWESLSVRETRVAERIAELAARVEDARATSAIAQQTSLSLKRDVERLLAAPPVAAGESPRVEAATPPPDLGAFEYLAFENEFRGSPALIRARLETYVPIFDGQSDVLDIGCGRGEFLDLLRQRGISARGIDLNPAMVEDARSRGLDATCADALTYLRGRPDASLGGVFAAQVVEHLTPAYLGELLDAAAEKVRPGGRIVLETINPRCWVAFFESYLRDPTHVRPLHPETLQYLLRVRGFQHVELRFSSPVAAADRLQPVVLPDSRDSELADAVAVINDNTTRLNGWLFSFQDYAVVATK